MLSQQPCLILLQIWYTCTSSVTATSLFGLYMPAVGGEFASACHDLVTYFRGREHLQAFIKQD